MHTGIWPAWFDGDQFWVEPEALMKLLGYEILLSDTTELAVRDQRHAILFRYTENAIQVNEDVHHHEPFSMIGSDGNVLITIEALEHAFGTDIVWDIDALTLQLSSAAMLFDPTQFAEPEDPPVLFPRERTWLGGVHIGYTLSHRWYQHTGRTLTPVGRVAAHIAGGTMRWDVSRHTSRLHYTIDLDTPWVTRIQVGQIGDGFGAQISNRPLDSRQIHREEVIQGSTIPHSIVRGKVSGAIREEVQADLAGRYRLQHPVFYGSTETEVEVEPLGASPKELSKTYWLTPSEILPAGVIEYDVTLSDQPYGRLSWGMSSRFTIQASATRFPQTVMVRALALLRPTMNLDVKADVLERSATGQFHWWRPWGGVNASTQMYQDRQQGSISFSLHGGGGSLHTQVSHHRSTSQESKTSLRSILGWQIQNLGVQTGVRIRSGESMELRPRLSYVLPIVRPRIHIQAMASITDQQIQSYEGGILASGRKWSSGVKVTEQRHGLEVRGSLQFNTDWAWFHSRGGYADGEFFHTQTLQGTIMIGEDIRFAALYEQRTQAVIRLFMDTNLNGVLDAGESLSYRHQIDMDGHLLLHRTDGEVIAPNLIAYRTYPIHIHEESLPDPLYHPATGYRFAFVATPGRTRYLNIALQPLPTVFGQLTEWDGSYTVLQVQLHNSSGVRILDVYQDGAFFAPIPPENYRATIVNLLTNETINETNVDLTHGQHSFTLSVRP